MALMADKYNRFTNRALYGLAQIKSRIGLAIV